MNANDKQVGGDHYSDGGSRQHWDEMAAMFGAAWFVGCATKYLARHTKKNGLQDMLKAEHYMEKLVELCETQAGLFALMPAPDAALAIGVRFCENNRIPESDREAMVALFMVRDENSAASALDDIRILLAHHYPDAAAEEEAEDAGAPSPAYVAQAADSVFAPPPIAGYRPLDGRTVNVLNACKTIGNGVGDQLLKVKEFLREEAERGQEALNKGIAAAQDFPEGSEEATNAQQAAIAAAHEADASIQEGLRWLAVAKTDLQKGFMALARAVTRPKGF